ncbi:hypothetical protein A8B82_13545 [Sulfitobacter sp. EhC04]|uniref:hypothetical protein n=1 Tax=Sulfitobacter sp. EhC04 TaxID=1849168 RepID=UPI0007F4FA5A|nr:hypothetical protein [Sulfitobacter sp. EhC04]OAN77219.1 hypothetical protein A8B82_13545 [Sulfitobacter sp. EhC04]
MFDPKVLFCFCGMEELTLSSFSSALEVGVGLYLGLAILQVIGSGGIADLARRSLTLQSTINVNSLHGLRAESNRIKADLAKLEISLQGFSRQVFAVVLLLLSVCLAVLALAIVIPDYPTTCWQSYSILGYFLLMPILVFVGLTVWMRYRCIAVRSAIKLCERKVNEKLLHKN